MSFLIGYNGIIRDRKFYRGTVGGRPVYKRVVKGMRYGRTGGRWFRVTGGKHFKSIMGI